MELVAGGYRLSVRAQDVDACQFEGLAARGRREMVAGAHKEAAATLGAALGLWQGAALADVREAPFADPVATACSPRAAGRPCRASARCSRSWSGAGTC
jgi:hypothetical protein